MNRPLVKQLTLALVFAAATMFALPRNRFANAEPTTQPASQPAGTATSEPSASDILDELSKDPPPPRKVTRPLRTPKPAPAPSTPAPQNPAPQKPAPPAKPIPPVNPTTMPSEPIAPPTAEPKKPSTPESATVESAANQPAAVPGDASNESDEIAPRREPSATDILKELSSDRNAPSRPIVRPSMPGMVVKTEPSPDAVPPNAVAPLERKLRPDGYRIVDRNGRLTREGDYYTFAFESRGQGVEDLPLRLLPNRLLEDMEQFSAGGKKPVVFVVSGEITEYHGVNYLLVQKLLTRPELGNLK